MNLTTAPMAPIERPTVRGELAAHTHIVNQENVVTLIQEALARSHQHEAQRAAAEHRLARSIVAGRRWARLAAWASARAERARHRTG
ncbi:hypothetical protein [Pseudonocardia sp. HH130630-07]|uniref:hypothetical protein n=1 Tax=Pseudonocardia sp. HH130630-07 TaxID=1690815 RepID=UPI000814F58F|nr:hypothetical protein [Pseudonocardia sp. HH130630-07]ANY05894.1 hypothetical protein AFB00_05785 [Pseudonocardia sp. HH130630-07]